MIGKNTVKIEFYVSKDVKTKLKQKANGKKLSTYLRELITKHVR